MSNSVTDIPELARINNLLGAIRGSRSTSQAVAPSAKLEAQKAPPKKALRTPDGLPLGSQEVGSFLLAMNWANDPTKVPSPLVDGRGNVRMLRGALPLNTFLGLVNWNNHPATPSWPVREGAAVEVGLHSSVESVFSGFSWGD